MRPVNVGKGTDEEFQIYEKTGGVGTQRAVVAFNSALDTDYHIVAILDGQTITAYVNGANKISYASAAAGENVTKHGMAGNADTQQFDNFAIFPRTSTTQYENILSPYDT